MQYGAESLAIDKYGMNLMNPVCSATIILEAISGTKTTGTQAHAHAPRKDETAS
jgi:hypothetical protein